MTEKKERFSIEQTMTRECIVDNTTGEQLDTIDYTERLCDLLNELNQEAKDNEHYHTVVLENYKAISKENEQLKESNERFSKTVAEQIIMIKEYREENEQLRQVMGFLENDNANDILGVLNSREGIFEQLRNENEQLKKELYQQEVSEQRRKEYDEFWKEKINKRLVK